MPDTNYNALTVTKKPDKSITREGTTWYLKSVDQTLADGTLTWAELTESDYLYVEVQAPNGYNLDSTERSAPDGTGAPYFVQVHISVPGCRPPADRV